MPSVEQRRKALTSIYFHGRREQIERLSVTVSRRMMPLETAIDVLEARESKDDVRDVRMAVVDLVRTRAGNGRSRLDRHIQRLTGTLKSHYSEAPQVDFLDEAFTRIFDRADRSPQYPDDAYREALAHMQRIHHQHHKKDGEPLTIERHESRSGKAPPFALDGEKADASTDTAPDLFAADRPRQEQELSRPPASGTSGTLFQNVTVKAFLDALDPRKWTDHAPELWNASYLVVPPAAGAPLRSRKDPPEEDKAAKQRWVDRLFYEDVHVLGYDYRNLLLSSFSRKPEGAPDEELTSIEFEYREVDCLNHESKIFGIRDGGIDVDRGGAICRAVDKGVHVEFSKTVRFTEPAFAQSELAALSKVLVPLTLDSWLHLLVF
ncbi:MAG TPA: hypothetical protein VMU50_17965 [Polyangia bacterium]|nr:hypothetical protein [Polyangia bacterium]